MDVLQTPIEYLKGVGPNRANMLKQELNIFTFFDPLVASEPDQFHSVFSIRKSGYQSFPSFLRYQFGFDYPSFDLNLRGVFGQVFDFVESRSVDVSMGKKMQ